MDKHTLLAGGIVIIAILFGLMFLHSQAHAAMPNFIGTGYYLPPCDTNDSVIQERVDGGIQDTGCTPKAAKENANRNAYLLQQNGRKMKPGSSIVTVDETVEHCPAWFIMGCVMPQNLIK